MWHTRCYTTKFRESERSLHSSTLLSSGHFSLQWNPAPLTRRMTPVLTSSYTTHRQTQHAEKLASILDFSPVLLQGFHWFGLELMWRYTITTQSDWIGPLVFLGFVCSASQPSTGGRKKRCYCSSGQEETKWVTLCFNSMKASRGVDERENLDFLSFMLKFICKKNISGSHNIYLFPAKSRPLWNSPGLSESFSHFFFFYIN